MGTMVFWKDNPEAMFAATEVGAVVLEEKLLVTVSTTPYEPVALTTIEMVEDAPLEVCAGQVAIEAGKLDESG
jgi:hypothetical protein